MRDRYIAVLILLFVAIFYPPLLTLVAAVFITIGIVVVSLWLLIKFDEYTP